MSGVAKQRSVHSSTSGRIVTENPALLHLLRERTGDSSIGTPTRPDAGGTRCVITDLNRLDNFSHSSHNPAYTNIVSTQTQRSAVTVQGSSTRHLDQNVPDVNTIIENDQKITLDVKQSDLQKITVSRRVRDLVSLLLQVTSVVDLNISQVEKDTQVRVISGSDYQKAKVESEQKFELYPACFESDSKFSVICGTDSKIKVTLGSDPKVKVIPGSDPEAKYFRGQMQRSSPDQWGASEGPDPASTWRSDDQGQPTTHRSDIVKDSLDATQNLPDSVDIEQSQQFRDSLDFDYGKDSPVTGRKTYPVESPTSNKVPNIKTASAHSRHKANTRNQSRSVSELSQGIPTPKPSAGVPDSAKARVPLPSVRTEDLSTKRSTSSVYAVANPAVLAAQGDRPPEGTQNTKFTPRAEQAVQRRENTQGSVKPPSVVKQEDTHESIKLQSVQDISQDIVKPQESAKNTDSAKPLKQGQSVNNNAKVNSATSGRKGSVSFPDNSDNEEEPVRAYSNHLKERVPTPHPRSPLKHDQASPRHDPSPRIQESDTDGQSDGGTPKPPVQLPQRLEKTPSPVAQKTNSANAANKTLPTVKRVYVDSPTFTKEEENQYRFVESRLDDGHEDLENTYRELGKEEDRKHEAMAATYATQPPPQQRGGHPDYTRDNYGPGGGAYTGQYDRPPQEPQYREENPTYSRKEPGGPQGAHYSRKDSDGPGAPHGGQYSRKDSEGPDGPYTDQYGRNNNQGQRPQGYDYQGEQNQGYSYDTRGGGDNQGGPRGQQPQRDPRIDDRYEDRNKVIKPPPNRYEDRNEQPRYEDRNQYNRYEDRDNGYDGERGGQYDEPQYRDNRPGPGQYDGNDRSRYNDRNTYDDRNDGDYRQPRSLIQNGYGGGVAEEDEQLKQEEEYQAHLQRRLQTQAQQDEDILIPKLPLEDSLEDPWQNPPPPPPQGYHQSQNPYGSDENETARMEVVNPAPVKYDFVENNKVDFGKVPDKSYAFLLERKKEGENKLDDVFITPKVPTKHKQRHPSQKERINSPPEPEDYIPSENASMAEALWAKRSVALEKRKDSKVTGKSKTASGTSLRKNRGLQKYPSVENGLIRQPLYSQGASQGRQPVHMYGTPTRNHYLDPIDNKPPPRPQHDSHASHPMSFKPIELKPVTQEIVTEDGQRISVDINLKVLSPRGEGADPRGVPQVTAEVLQGSQATGGPRPVGTQYHSGYDRPDPNPYYQAPPALPPPEYNFDYSQAPDKENQLPPQIHQEYQPQYQPQGSPHYHSQQHHPQDPAPQTQSPTYQSHPAYNQSQHPQSTYDHHPQTYDAQHQSYDNESKNRSPNPYPKIPPISSGLEDPFAGPIRVELQGYSAIHQKNRQKDPNEQPWYQVYTLNDYKKLKKELEANRGPLGPDLESETFKEKLEKKHKQNEYARLVMERNRQELLDRKPVRRQSQQQMREDSNKRRTVSPSLVYDSYLNTPVSEPPGKRIHQVLSSTSAPGRLLPKARPRGEANRRKLALDYAKNNVPKPVVKQKPSQYNSYEMASQLSPHAKKGPQSPVKTQAPVEVVDLQKLQRRHEEEKQNVAMLKQNIPQKV